MHRDNFDQPILLVDDNPADVELTLRTIMRSHIANPIDVARDGVEALDYLLRQHHFRLRKSPDPCLVLLDLRLPLMNGAQVLAKMRSNNTLAKLPVIVLASALHDLEEFGMGGSLPDTYLIKPVAFADFRSKIDELHLSWILRYDGRILNQNKGGPFGHAST